MTVPSYVEELYLRASTLLDRGKLEDSKQLLEEILQAEPRYGRALNQLGYIYEQKFQDYKKAETLYRLAIKYAPLYSPTYINLIELLIVLNRLRAAEKQIETARQVPGIDQVSLEYQMGSIRELQGRYRQAIHHYKLSRKACLNDGFIRYLDGAIRRAREKAGILVLGWVFGAGMKELAND